MHTEKTEIINETRIWFFKRINETDKPLAIQMNMKRYELPISGIKPKISLQTVDFRRIKRK